LPLYGNTPFLKLTVTIATQSFKKHFRRLPPVTSVLESEICQQPDVLARLLDNPVTRSVAEAIRKADPAYITIAARGSSDNAARYAKYLLGIHCGLSVTLAAPSISTLYGHPLRYRNSVVIGISQSGRSVDVGQIVTDAAAQGALTISITNDPESPMAQAAAYHIDLGAGEERSLAASKTYTGQLMAIALITAHLADSDDMRADLARVPAFVNEMLELAPTIMQRAERFRFMTRCVTLGRGYNYATAFEIALKLKELSYVTAEPYSSADFRHGPKAMVEDDFPIIAIAPSGAVYPDMLNLIKELRERGADLTVISTELEALGYAQFPLPLPVDVPEWITPIVGVVPGQLLAMATAAAKGHEFDRPRNLTKVTMTR
jgi:glucosamine--fructose-6-phosphate aminotransferase (isomerizing)